ncbi:MAG: response regulator [Fuerstiella sp.]
MAKPKFMYLVVEDDDDHAALIQRNLRKTSPDSLVSRVRDGEEALQFLRRQSPYEDSPRPDLILLDMKLPGVNGLQVLENIKADDDLCSIPVVMLTTSATRDDRQKAYRLHANSYLVKPMGFDGFRSLVGEICHYWGDVNTPVTDAS